MIDFSLMTFQEGQIIEDRALIDQLVAEHDPIRPMVETDKTVVCPHCHKSFLLVADAALEMSAETKAKIERLGLF